MFKNFLWDKLIETMTFNLQNTLLASIVFNKIDLKLLSPFINVFVLTRALIWTFSFILRIKE